MVQQFHSILHWMLTYPSGWKMTIAEKPGMVSSSRAASMVVIAHDVAEPQLGSQQVGGGTAGATLDHSVHQSVVAVGSGGLVVEHALQGVAQLDDVLDSGVVVETAVAGCGEPRGAAGASVCHQRVEQASGSSASVAATSGAFWVLA